MPPLSIRSNYSEKHKNAFLLLFVALFLLFLLFPQIRYHFLHVEFEPYINDISISDSSIRFKSDNYGVQAIVMGELTNGTAYVWKDVLF